MNEETTIIANPNGSQAFGVSIRAWLALLLTLTVCLQSIFGQTIVEPLYSLSIMALGFYFGQKTSPTTKP